MIIVLEGPDLAGKSTIAKELQEHYERRNYIAKIVKFSQPEATGPIALFAEYVRSVYLAYSAEFRVPDTVHIFDRLHVGEWIYGPRKRANSQLSWNQLVAIDDMLDAINARKFYVHQTKATLTERFHKRGETFVTPLELLDIADHYRQLLDPLYEPNVGLHIEPKLRSWIPVKTINDVKEFL